MQIWRVSCDHYRIGNPFPWSGAFLATVKAGIDNGFDLGHMPAVACPTRVASDDGRPTATGIFIHTDLQMSSIWKSRYSILQIQGASALAISQKPCATLSNESNGDLSSSLNESLPVRSVPVRQRSVLAVQLPPGSSWIEAQLAQAIEFAGSAETPLHELDG